MNNTYLIAAVFAALAASIVGAALLVAVTRGVEARKQQIGYLSTIAYCLSVLITVAERAEQRQRRAEETQNSARS